MALNYPELADQWEDDKCFQSPSALHGWLTGYLAAGGRLTTENWLQEATDYLEIEAMTDGLRPLLVGFYADVVDTLSAEDMAYQVLLPDDEEADVDEQVECLAQWSKGFLDGLGASGKIAARPDKDVMEVLQDLDAFSQAQVEDVNDPENVQLLNELAEHARVAALTVFYAYNKPAPQAGTTEQKPLH
ncbi:MAG: UPF0149 family protein [Pseudomonadota bacterium]|nr:UPF0149 family protein [Pseudomonadota bacterium]